jgi:hypothetical protein
MPQRAKDAECSWVMDCGQACGMRFDNPAELFKHVMEHTRGVCGPFICKWKGCNKEHSRKDSLGSHVRIHLTHRPFMCQTCPKTFKRKSDLREHNRVHRRRGEGYYEDPKQRENQLALQYLKRVYPHQFGPEMGHCEVSPQSTTPTEMFVPLDLSQPASLWAQPLDSFIPCNDITWLDMMLLNVSPTSDPSVDDPLMMNLLLSPF